MYGNEIDLIAKLPNGQMFSFWEVDQKFEKEIHVDNQNPAAFGDNESTVSKPIKTINAVVQVATLRLRVFDMSLERDLIMHLVRLRKQETLEE